MHHDAANSVGQSGAYDEQVDRVPSLENNRTAWRVAAKIVVLREPQQCVVSGDDVGHGQAPRTSARLVVHLTLSMLGQPTSVLAAHAVSAARLQAKPGPNRQHDDPRLSWVIPGPGRTRSGN